MKWFHGTQIESCQSILKHGFVTHDGSYGKGVYATSSREGACIFGSSILQLVISDEYVTYFNFEEMKEEQIDDDFWINEVNQMGIQAIAMKYISGEIELIIYDPSIIQEVSIIN
ncbi:hypothetical protein POF51_29630 [Brevibacillus sp. AG]|uniref:hypothetical protein n=1 Tax=Brevibacillus sp. AG TaxID=3020891 RepID=UPI00232D4FE6|nr:hypothetical protein [Brevibacillus sp. AG]MDC0764885.1 hypothetical protein [Brevibacillus sp. AG]